MKNKVFLAVLALSLGLSPALVLAQTATNTPGYRLIKPFQDIREEYKEKREELKDDLKNASTSEDKQQIRAEQRDEQKDQVNTLRLERIRAFMLQMQRRLEAALARSQKFVDRINAFLSQREQEGQDISKVKVKVDEANAVIASSTIKINEIPSKIETALTSSSTPKEIFLSVKGIMNEGVTAVKAAHQKVVEAVRLLKTLAKPADNSSDDSATSTESN